MSELDHLLPSRRDLIDENRSLVDENAYPWTDEFDSRARVRMARLIREWVPLSERSRVYAKVCALVEAETGFIVTRTDRISMMTGGISDEFEDAVRTRVPNACLPDVIQAASAQIDSEEFDDAVRAVLEEHRIEWDLVEGRMIRRASQELHAEVIVPTLRLLSGRGGWEAVESAYQDALQEIAEGEPRDAITDVARALEEALETRGAHGTSIGERLKAARKLGILGGGDERLVGGIEQFVKWAAALRGSKSDAHPGTREADRTDAWLAVHVVGALILRLGEESAG